MAVETELEAAIHAEAAAVAVGAQPLRHSWARVIDSAIGILVEPVCAVLIVIEVAILTAGVFSRYVLHNALVWTDELATILFLWLSMLGAVIAFRRKEHMRLTYLARRFPHAAPWFDVVGSVVVTIFTLEMLPASQKLFAQEMIDLTPALQLPRSYIIAAIFTGMLLMLVMAVLRLIDAPPRILASVGGAAVVIVAVAWLLRPGFATLGNINLVLFFVVLVGACIILGVPIAFSFGMGTLSYLALTTSTPLDVVVGRMDEGASNLVLLAVPLFVLLGVLIENAGISKRLVDFIASLVGHFRGGLGIVLLFAMYLVSGISGSKAADMAAVAPVLFPEMRRRGTPQGELVALLSSSGAMAETIPPSLVLIIIGSVTGVSIAALFTAGLLPAAVAALALLIVVVIRSRFDRTELASRPTLKRIVTSFFVAIPGLALPLLIRAFVLGGVATATEVSTAGIIYTVLVGVIIYREFRWNNVYFLLRETAALTGAIMLIIATATAMSWALTQSGFAQQLANGLSGSPGGKNGFIAFSLVIFLVLGSVLEGIPAIVLFGPLLFPIAQQFHVHEVHYAIIAVLAMGIGLFAPPLGVGFYSACAIGKCEADEAMGRIIPYILALLVALLLVAFVPWLSIGFLAPQR